MSDAHALHLALRGPRSKGSAIKFLIDVEYGRVHVHYRSSQAGAIVGRRIRDYNDYRNFLASKADEAGVRVEDLQITISDKLREPETNLIGADQAELAKRIIEGA